MPEKLDDRRLHSTAGRFAISAVTLAAPEARERIFGGNQGTGNIVQLLVNGVEVPFAETINNWWDRCEADLNERAAELAMKKFYKLREIDEFIVDVRSAIRQKVEETFNVTLVDDEY
jgi:hypothetical protein